MNNKKVAIYTRVSTNYQIDKDSLPYQKNELIKYAEYALGITNYEIFEDAGYSGKNTDRPAFQDMMKRVRSKEFSHILVLKIDRISRNLLDFATMYEEIKKYGATFVSKNEQFDTSSAMGEAMLKIILIFAELERKLTAERVFGVMLSRAEKGLWNGANVPLGYDWSEDKKFPVINPEEAATVKFIYDKYLEIESTVKAAKMLNGDKMKTKRGGVWTSKTISDIIRNPFYKGTYRYNYRESARGEKKDESEWIVIPDNHPAIIDKEIWEKCNEIMDKNALGNNVANRQRLSPHIFRGLIKCGSCGASFFSGQDRPRADGYRPSTYRCKNRAINNGCEQPLVSDVLLGPFVFGYIANLVKLQDDKFKINTISKLEDALLSGSYFDNVAGLGQKGLETLYSSFLFGDYVPSSKSENTKQDSPPTFYQVEILKNKQKKHEKALVRLQDMYLFDDMSEKDYLLKKMDISTNLEEIKKEISELMKKEKNLLAPSDLDFISKASNLVVINALLEDDEIDFKKLFELMGEDNLREFLIDIVKEIIVVDRKVISIEFTNGMTHKFVHRENEA